MNETSVSAKATMSSNEMEVIGRLKVKPKTYDITAHVDTSNNNDPRCWVKLCYPFNGKLSTFGKFLDGIAKDVYQAGGVVTEFQFSGGTGLRPNNSDPDNYAPSGPWLAMFVYAHIKTRLHVEERAAAFREAVKDLIGART